MKLHCSELCADFAVEVALLEHKASAVLLASVAQSSFHVLDQNFVADMVTVAWYRYSAVWVAGCEDCKCGSVVMWDSAPAGLGAVGSLSNFVGAAEYLWWLACCPTSSLSSCSTCSALAYSL